MLRRTGNAPDEQASSVMMTEANIKRLVSKLSQMRGAALKLGQFMSIQGERVPNFVKLVAKRSRYTRLAHGNR